MIVIWKELGVVMMKTVFCTIVLGVLSVSSVCVLASPEGREASNTEICWFRMLSGLPTKGVCTGITFDSSLFRSSESNLIPRFWGKDDSSVFVIDERSVGSKRDQHPRQRIFFQKMEELEASFRQRFED